MLRWSAWSVAITPPSTVENPLLPVVARTVLVGHLLSTSACVATETDRNPAALQSCHTGSTQDCHGQVIGNDVGKIGSPAPRLVVWPADRSGRRNPRAGGETSKNTSPNGGTPCSVVARSTPSRDRACAAARRLGRKAVMPWSPSICRGLAFRRRASECPRFVGAEPASG